MITQMISSYDILHGDEHDLLADFEKEKELRLNEMADADKESDFWITRSDYNEEC